MIAIFKVNQTIICPEDGDCVA